MSDGILYFFLLSNVGRQKQGRCHKAEPLPGRFISDVTKGWLMFLNAVSAAQSQNAWDALITRRHTHTGKSSRPELFTPVLRQITNCPASKIKMWQVGSCRYRAPCQGRTCVPGRMSKRVFFFFVVVRIVPLEISFFVPVPPLKRHVSYSVCSAATFKG